MLLQLVSWCVMCMFLESLTLLMCADIGFFRLVRHIILGDKDMV